jgi:hypothetical protein
MLLSVRLLALSVVACVLAPAHAQDSVCAYVECATGDWPNTPCSNAGCECTSGCGTSVWHWTSWCRVSPQCPGATYYDSWFGSDYHWQDCNLAPVCEPLSRCGTCPALAPVNEPSEPSPADKEPIVEVDESQPETAPEPQPAPSQLTDSEEDAGDGTPVVTPVFDPPLPACTEATEDVAFYFRRVVDDPTVVEMLVSSKAPVGALSGALDDCAGTTLTPTGASGGLLGEAGYAFQPVDGGAGIFAFVNERNETIAPTDAVQVGGEQNKTNVNVPISGEFAATKQAAAPQPRVFVLWTRFSFPEGATTRTCAEDPLGVSVFAHAAASGAIESSQCVPPPPSAQIGPAGNATGNASLTPIGDAEPEAFASAKSP